MNSAIASNPLFAAIFDKENEPSVSALMKHKSIVAGVIFDSGLTIMEELSDNEDSEQIQEIISDYIRRNLTKKEINNIISDYGISKAMKLFYDFQKIGLNSPYIEICEILSMEDYGLENELVELILKEEIGFETSWRTTGDGVPMTPQEIAASFRAHSIACA
jgi:hypothetical protein